MRKFVLTVMASLLSCSFAQAFWPTATDSSLEIGVGYRQDNFKWQTNADFDASNYNSYSSNSDNISFNLPLSVKSKLEWKNLNIWQIEARGKYVTCDNVYLRACADYGWITSGKNRDRDYINFGFDDNNSSSYSSYGNSGFEFANSSSKVDGNVYDVKLAAGYQFQLCDDTFSISPLVGYSWHGQRLKDRHLRQNFFLGGIDPAIAVDAASSSAARSYSSYYYYSDSSSYSDSYYSYSGEHSTYHTRWNGPFIGFDFDYNLWCDWNLFGGYEFHFAEFHGRGHWNLRNDLVDGFHQRSKNAYGQVFDIGLQWEMCDCWTLSVKGQFQWWYAHHGKDKAKIAELEVGNVKAKTFLEVPTRATKWDSAGVTVYVGTVF